MSKRIFVSPWLHVASTLWLFVSLVAATAAAAVKEEGTTKKFLLDEHGLVDSAKSWATNTAADKTSTSISQRRFLQECTALVPESKFKTVVLVTLNSGGNDLTKDQMELVGSSFVLAWGLLSKRNIEKNDSCDPYFRIISEWTVFNSSRFESTVYRLEPSQTDQRMVGISIIGRCQDCKDRATLLQRDSSTIISPPPSASDGGCNCPSNSILRLPSVDEFLPTLDDELSSFDSNLSAVSVDSRVFTNCGAFEQEFTFETIVELNEPCNSSKLSDADQQALGTAYVVAYNNLATRYCDEYFRTVQNATVVKSQQVVVANEPILRIQVQVQGTLRCFSASPADGCNLDDIGLFDVPSTTKDGEQAAASGDPSVRRSLQEGNETCGCPVDAVANNRGPSENEFIQVYQDQVAMIADSLDCSALQVADCGFGDMFESTLQVTIANEQDDSDLKQVELAALEALNILFRPDDPETSCNPVFRVFEDVRAVGSNIGRRRASFKEEDNPQEFPRQLQEDTEDFNNMTSSSPTNSPTPLFAVSTPNPTTFPGSIALLFVSGVCSGCSNDLFLSNQVDGRRMKRQRFAAETLGWDFGLTTEELRPRNLQSKAESQPLSNCYCGLNATEIVPPPGISDFETLLEDLTTLEITEIIQIDNEQIEDDDDECGPSAPFTFQTIVEFNETCGESSSLLSDGDKLALGNAYVVAYNNLAASYCDENFRVVENATVTETQQVVAANGEPAKLRMLVQVEATLLCVSTSAGSGCDLPDTGLFDLPTTDNVSGPSGRESCGCPVNAVANRGPSEDEFIDEFQGQVSSIASTLDCTTLQIADCGFGDLFESAFQLSFAEDDVGLEQVESAALESLNLLFTPADPESSCNPNFRVFENVRIVGARRNRRTMLQEDNETTNTSRKFDDYDPSARLLQDIDVDSNVTLFPSNSPTPLFDATTASPTPLFGSTASLFVSGVCSGCSNELFLSNQVDGRIRWRRRTLDIPSRSMLEAEANQRDLQNSIPTSNCFCGLNATDIVSPPDISDFETLLEELTLLEITNIVQIDSEDEVTYTYPCTDEVSTFEKNITIEIEYTCESDDGVPTLSNLVQDEIASAFVATYNTLRANVCDPFDVRVDTAEVTQIGRLRSDNGLPLQLRLSLFCNGCDIDETNLYGLPESAAVTVPSAAGSSSGSPRRAQEQTCECDASLPRRPPLETDVILAMNEYLLDRDQPCVGNATDCSFGSTFLTNLLLEVELDDTLDQGSTAILLQEAFTSTLNDAIRCDNPKQCNPLFGYVQDSAFFLDFVYNTLGRGKATDGLAGRRRLQQEDQDDEVNAVMNVSEAPSVSPTISFASAGNAIILLSASGVCNGCTQDLFLGNQVSGRRHLSSADALSKNKSRPPNVNLRFLQDVTDTVDASSCSNNTSGELGPESNCYCAIDSVVLNSTLTKESFIEKLRDEATRRDGRVNISRGEFAVFAECSVEESRFESTIAFEFSAKRWVEDAPGGDLQDLGNEIAKAYNNLVIDFCDEYFRNSITATYVRGSLTELATPQRHHRNLQFDQLGCYNFQADFTITGLCRGCQDLSNDDPIFGRPIPVFGMTTMTRNLESRTVENKMTSYRSVDSSRFPELHRDDIQSKKFERRKSGWRTLQNRNSNDACVCDEKASQQRDAPSLVAIQERIGAVDWTLISSDHTICGLPVESVNDCPTLPIDMTVTESFTQPFFVANKDGTCLTVGDLNSLANLFLDVYNDVKRELFPFPCQPEYVQISQFTFDTSSLPTCTTRRLSSDHRRDLQTRDAVQVTGTIEVNGNSGDPVSKFDAGNAVVEATERVNVDSAQIILNDASASPSSSPSDFPSSFPSEFPSEFPSSFPSQFPSEFPSSFPSQFPSESPTDFPSDNPSDISSDTPSDNPSDIPTDNPSDIPSDIPTDIPSDNPSHTPSNIPSHTPSNTPSNIPSDTPSGSPSDLPTLRPSQSPSDNPSTTLVVTPSPFVATGTRSFRTLQGTLPSSFLPKESETAAADGTGRTTTSPTSSPVETKDTDEKKRVVG